jgi:hypothetical protein
MKEVLQRVSRQQNATKQGQRIYDGQLNCDSERQIFSSDFQGDMDMQSRGRNLKGKLVVSVKNFPSANLVDQPPSPSSISNDPPDACLPHRNIVTCFFGRVLDFCQFHSNDGVNSS